MLILSGQDVRDSLPMSDAIEVMKQAFASLARGEAVVPLRTHVPAHDGDGVTLIMPARVEGESSALAVKVVSVFDRNVGVGIPRIQAAVIALDPDTGRPLALLEGSALTAIRTAAASGAATDLLADPASETLAVLGAGVQARSHIDAMCSIRPISTIRIFDAEPGKASRVIDELGATLHPSCQISSAESAAAAVREADIICTTTTSRTQVFEDADVKPGAHINAVGAYTPNSREVGGATVARAWVAVDDRGAAWAEAGELIQARDEGLIDANHVRADLGELVLDAELRPPSPDQLTLFKTVGVAVQDAAAAAATIEAAERMGLGTVVAW